MSSPSKSELAGGRISPKPLSTSTGRISPRRPSSRSGNPLKKSTSSSPVTFLESETLTNSQSSAYARRVRELSERFDFLKEAKRKREKKMNAISIVFFNLFKIISMQCFDLSFNSFFCGKK